jgi:hypothetical protein
MGCSLSASRLLGCRDAQNYGSQQKGCRAAEYESIGDGVDASLSRKLSTSTREPVVAIGACLDHDLIQGNRTRQTPNFRLFTRITLRSAAFCPYS